MRLLKVRRKEILVVVLACLVLAAGVMAIVQPDIQNFTTSPGGVSSNGGSLVVRGTFGQHDASDTLTGGGFRLTGGLWGAGNGFRINLPLIQK